MKSLLLSISIMIVLLITWTTVYSFICERVEKLCSLVDDMESKIHIEKWTSTLSLFNNINKEWKDSRGILLLILQHEEIERINVALERTRSYISIKNKPLTLGEAATLKFLFRHIQEKESLSLKNIF